jgi:hypothetical protein
LRYEAAGDMYVGRTVCGLPNNSPKFALLPPHFPAIDAEIDDAIIQMFGPPPTGLRLILEFCLASIVYNSPFLTETLPEFHPIKRYSKRPSLEIRD